MTLMPNPFDMHRTLVVRFNQRNRKCDPSKSQERSRFDVKDRRHPHMSPLIQLATLATCYSPCQLRAARLQHLWFMVGVREIPLSFFFFNCQFVSLSRHNWQCSWCICENKNQQPVLFGKALFPSLCCHRHGDVPFSAAIRHTRWMKGKQGSFRCWF